MKKIRLEEEHKASSSSSSSVHLGQIQRVNLDFDFEKVCSVTLSPRNVYCCLVCGKYFQGRAMGSPLFAHALQHSHFVCINLTTREIYSLPDNVLVQNETSLEDIVYNLRPTFSPEAISALSLRTNSRRKIRDLHDHMYFPGLVGMQGLSYINAVIQSLVRVPPFRNFFLQRTLYEKAESALVQSFGDLVCQIFNNKRFKASICPHEFLHVVSATSKFSVPGLDASQFLSWLLFELNKGLKRVSRIVLDCFQGHVQVNTVVTELKREFAAESPDNVAGPSATFNHDLLGEEKEDATKLGTSTRAIQVEQRVENIPFFFLSMDLPTTPLFKDAIEGQTVLPQTTLMQVLEKYDGKTCLDVALPGGKVERKTFRIKVLPRYLLLHLKRFTKNHFFVEKNRAQVTIPISELDMSPYLETTSGNCNYHLLANVCHVDNHVLEKRTSAAPPSSDAMKEGTYKANVYYHPEDAWFEMNDLDVREGMPQLVAVSETFLALYERSSSI